MTAESSNIPQSQDSNASNNFDTRSAGDTEIIWDDVSSRLESFAQAWDEVVQTGSSPPEIADFLPPLTSASRPFTLVELIKVDMERRLSGEQTIRTIQTYIESFPELQAGGGVPVDLLYEDIYIRQQHGQQVDVEAFLADYPQQKDVVKRMLKFDRNEESTCLSNYCPKIEVGPGDTVDDFELLARLGKGAFASVYLARQVSMQRIVAVKVSADRGREPQTLARLDHPNIVRIYDQRILANRGLKLLYMQYVPGGTLYDVLKTLRKEYQTQTWNGATLLKAIDARLEDQAVAIPHDSANRRELDGKQWAEVVCRLALQLAEALHYAHGQGVLHRDIKPANILISDSAVPKLVDFNISSCSKVEGASATAYFGGSLAYMSPEQMEACNPRHELTAEALGPTSDVYALGVVIWELLTGARPFEDQIPESGWTATLDALIDMRQIGVRDSAWETLKQKAPAGMIDLLRKCLTPDPADRWPTAAHVADQLRLCLHPKAQRLLAEPKKRIPKSMIRRPRLWLVGIVLLPNLLAGILNLCFNWSTMVQGLDKEEQAKFKAIVIVVNILLYSLGVLIGLWIARNEAKAVAFRSRYGAEEPSDRSLRHRCLGLGRKLAFLGIMLWCVAGVIWPIGLRMEGISLDLPLFVFSLIICGAIGASYPYFGATSMFVEAWYPALVRPGSVAPEDAAIFQREKKSSRIFLVLAVTVPLFSLALLSLRPEVLQPALVGSVAVGGLIIFGKVFLTWQRLSDDFDVLTELANAQAPHTN